jgi:hypothetical protein
MINQLIAATITALAATFSGFGIGFLWGFARGTYTVNKRQAAMIAGMLGGLAMFMAQIWLAYHGYNS